MVRAFLISFAGALGASLVAYFVVVFLVSGQEARVPYLTGKTPLEALRSASEADFPILFAGTEENASIEKGRVSRQRPVVGKTHKTGRPIRVWLSLGSRGVEVPDLSGMTERTARLTLQRLGLEVSRVTRTRAVEPTGSVVSQNPLAGQGVERGARVSLLVSTGPPPRVYVMPRLVGLQVNAALDVLEGPFVGRVEIVSESSGEWPAHSVIDQRPRPGHPISDIEHPTLVVAQPEESPGEMAVRILSVAIPPGPGTRELVVVSRSADGTRTELQRTIVNSGQTYNTSVSIGPGDVLEVFVDGERIEGYRLGRPVPRPLDRSLDLTPDPI